MLQVLQQTVQPISSRIGIAQLGRYVTAALLNAEYGLTPYLSVSTVQHIWNDIAGFPGYYQPTSGVQWGPTEAVNYLASTMGG